jgi:hypothetical protein
MMPFGQQCALVMLVEYGGQYANIMIIHEQETCPPIITIYVARISPEPRWNHYLNN